MSAADRYSGGAGNDVIQVGVAGVGTSIDLGAAASDGVNGFLSVEGITFVNTSGTSTATFAAAQFGTGKIATATAITGTAADQALAINVASGGSIDLSTWTFTTWTSGTDTITLTGSTGTEVLVGSTQIDRFVVSDSNQVSATDRYNGGTGNDILQIGVAGVGTSIDLGTAAADGVNGFLSIEGIAFVNTSGTSSATLNATQIGTGKIAAASAITGTLGSVQSLTVNVAAAGSVDLSAWTFANWTSGTDTITVNGSTGAETFTGATQAAQILAGAGTDTLIVTNTTQVQAGDRYDGGADADTLRIGTTDGHGHRSQRGGERRRRRLRQHRARDLRQLVRSGDGDVQCRPVRRRQDFQHGAVHRHHPGPGRWRSTCPPAVRSTCRAGPSRRGPPAPTSSP